MNRRTTIDARIIPIAPTNIGIAIARMRRRLGLPLTSPPAN